MSDQQISLAIWNALFLVFGLLASVGSNRRLGVRWFLAGIALFNVNVSLVLDLFGTNEYLYVLIGSPDVAFNWAGKLLALLFSLLLYLTPWFDMRSTGARFRQSESGKPGWIAVFAYCVVNIVVAAMLDDQEHTTEAIAYQLTMPSFEEEIFYRGILLYALTRAFDRDGGFIIAGVGRGACISAMLFTLIHCVNWVNGAIVFSLDAFLFAGFFAVFLTWLRLNTGSVLAPILLHSATNTIWRLV